MAIVKGAPRAVIYTRVSSGPQADGTSLDSQFIACRVKAEEMGATLVTACQDVESGASYRSRSGLQNALDIIERREADTLIIYDMSRYSRDTEHQQQIARRVATAGARLVFCTMDFGDPASSPEAKMAFGMNGVFAEFERLKIRERTQNGKRARVKQGVQVSRTLSPYGYTVVNKSHVLDGLFAKDQIGKYFIVEEKAVIVRQIFEQCVSGISLHAIARGLEKAGILSPTNKPTWPRNTVKFIINNPVYKGTPMWGRYQMIKDESRLEVGLKSIRHKLRPADEWLPLESPSIVTPEMWQQAQERLKSNMPGSAKRCYLMRGLLRCPTCGRRMTGTTIGGDAFYRARDKGIAPPQRYRCNSYNNEDETKRCGAVFHYYADKIETEFLSQFFKTATDSKRLTQHLTHSAVKQKANFSATKQDELRRHIAALREKQENLIEGQLRAIEAKISSAPYERRLRTTETEIIKTEAELETIEKLSARPLSQAKSVDAIVKVARELQEIFQSEEVSTLEKNRLLSIIIERVDILSPREYELFISFKT